MLKYHYSNPKFDGLPWAINGGRKKKKKKKKHHKKHKQDKQLKKLEFRQKRRDAEGRCRKFLETFWPRFNGANTSDERLAILKAAATPPWQRVSNELRLQLRKHFNRIAYRLLDVPVETCGVCEKRPHEKHHIVPLAFGGINEEINLLLICCDCHNAIHPWM